MFVLKVKHTVFFRCFPCTSPNGPLLSSTGAGWVHVQVAVSCWYRTPSRNNPHGKLGTNKRNPMKSPNTSQAYHLEDHHTSDPDTIQATVIQTKNTYGSHGGDGGGGEDQDQHCINYSYVYWYSCDYSLTGIYSKLCFTSLTLRLELVDAGWRDEKNGFVWRSGTQFFHKG